MSELSKNSGGGVYVDKFCKTYKPIVPADIAQADQDEAAIRDELQQLGLTVDTDEKFAIVCLASVAAVDCFRDGLYICSNTGRAAELTRAAINTLGLQSRLQPRKKRIKLTYRERAEADQAGAEIRDWLQQNNCALESKEQFFIARSAIEVILKALRDGLGAGKSMDSMQDRLYSAIATLRPGS